jgi:acyl-CoA thioesterase-2
VTLLGEVDGGEGQRLADLFVVAGEGDRLYAGTKVISSPSVFGGQLFGLAVVAATRSADDAYIPVSLQAQLLDRGDAGSGIDISVATLRDGRSTRHRRLTLEQGGRPIATVQVALETLPRGAVEAAGPHLDVTPPTSADHRSPFVVRWGFDEVEVVHQNREAIHPLWVKPRVALADDPALHAAAIAFVSDMALVMVAHEAGGDPSATPLTVDHAIWFHGVPRFDDWLYLDARLSSRQGDHALVFATITSARGNLVATVCQGVRLKRSGNRPR